MSEDRLEAVRRHLIDRLMGHAGVSWTCSSERLVLRAKGHTLCKVGRDTEHVLVEFSPEKPWQQEADEAPFVHPAPPGETPPEAWRQARLGNTDDADRLLVWLLS